ncbi:MAG: DNA repair protein RadC [Clostridia bacterium]|jgi:DNA repair protein RadC|nr:DNA repair protein RadC [Clostridia bacterium]
MENNLHTGHRARLKTRALTEGLESFDEHQILEMLLGFVIPRKDTNPIAHNLIEHFGSLGAVIDASPEDLIQICGMGSVSSQFLYMLPEIFKAYRKSKMDKRTPLKNLKQAEEYFKAYLQNLTREEFYLACLDSDLMLIKNILISEGTVNSANVQIRNITREALKFNSCSVILAHNHPSGQALPSAEDYKITKNIVLSLGLNGIITVDHLIIGNDTIYSFAGENQMQEFINNLEKMGGAKIANRTTSYSTENYKKLT